MASNILEANGATAMVNVDAAGEGVHLALVGDFGGGTITVMQNVNGTPTPLLDEGVAITFTASSDVRLNIVSNDQVWLDMAGATAPSVDWQFSGTGIAR